MPKLERLTIVLATWCPQCVPLSLDMVKEMSTELGVPHRVLDIDNPDEERLSDEIVRKYGDDCEDYIIPQVFGEFSGGSVKHIFTGFSEGTQVTKSRWESFFQSKYFEGLKSETESN